MSRDTNVKAMVTVSAERMICNNQPAAAAREFVQWVKEQFGASTRIEGLVIEIQEESGRTTRMMPDAGTAKALGSGQYPDLRLILDTSEVQSGPVLKHSARDFSTSYMGQNDLDVSLKMDPEAKPHTDLMLGVREIICPSCKGAGREGHGEVCSQCCGAGVIPERRSRMRRRLN